MALPHPVFTGLCPALALEMTEFPTSVTIDVVLSLEGFLFDRYVVLWDPFRKSI